MTPRPKKSIKEIIAKNPSADCSCPVSNPSESGDRHHGKMLYDGKSLVDRMKSAYKKRKREQKIDALKDSDTLWSGLQ